MGGFQELQLLVPAVVHLAPCPQAHGLWCTFTDLRFYQATDKCFSFGTGLNHATRARAWFYRPQLARPQRASQQLYEQQRVACPRTVELTCSCVKVNLSDMVDTPPSNPSMVGMVGITIGERDGERGAGGGPSLSSPLPGGDT